MTIMSIFNRRLRPIPATHMPLDVASTPYAQPPRHPDPGERFAPVPKPRADLCVVLPVPAGKLSVSIPPNVDGEVTWQLANGDWTPFRPASGTVANSTPAISVRWRVRGAP